MRPEIKIKRIEKLEEGYLIISNIALRLAERQIITAELKAATAEKIGLLFFRAEGGRA